MARFIGRCREPGSVHRDPRSAGERDYHHRPRRPVASDVFPRSVSVGQVRPPRVPLWTAVLTAIPWSDLPAHEGRALEPHDLWTSWSLEPWALMLLATSLVVYIRGTRRVWHAAGRGRG